MMLSALAQLAWGPWTLSLFLATGLYFSIRTGFFQLFGICRWSRSVWKSLRQPGSRGLSPLRTLSTSLAAAIGTGSIAGVATAITLGGPGAVFWMEVSAFLGMMTGCAEKILSIQVRQHREDGSWRGGPMVWLRAAGHQWLSDLFALCALLSSLCMGALVQSNSIAAGLHATFGLPTLLAGGITTLLAGYSLRGGLGQIGSVCERLVPLMAGLFLLSGGAILVLRRAMLPDAIRMIFSQAFSFRAGLSGGMGAAVRYGVARGLFTNEAGLGTTAMIHANSDNIDPGAEGMRGIFEVFVSTGLVCTLSALVLLITVTPLSTPLSGAALSAEAFRRGLGPIGGVILAVCLVLFAFSSILGSYTYGQLGLEHLGVRRATCWYLPFFLGCVVLGSVVDVTRVWALADVSTALMAWPSLLSLWIYREDILAAFRRFQQRC